MGSYDRRDFRVKHPFINFAWLANLSQMASFFLFFNYEYDYILSDVDLALAVMISHISNFICYFSYCFYFTALLYFQYTAFNCFYYFIKLLRINLIKYLFQNYITKYVITSSSNFSSSTLFSHVTVRQLKADSN